jgi:hypothetical protein
MGGDQGDSDAAADDDRAAGDLIRGADGLDQARSQNFRSMQQIAVSRHSNHRELVAAETRCDIGFAARRLDPSGHPIEDLISSLMSEGIVDVLESVEVEKKYREFHAETPMPRQRRLPQQQHDRIDTFEKAYGIFLEQPGSGVAALDGRPGRFGALSKHLQARPDPTQQDDHDAEDYDRVAQATQNRGL